MEGGLLTLRNLPLPQIVSDYSLVQAFSFVQELGHVFRGALQQVVFYEKLNSLKMNMRKEVSVGEPPSLILQKQEYTECSDAVVWKQCKQCNRAT